MPATEIRTATPGEQFAHAFRTDPASAEVRFDFTLSDAFQPTVDRPRLTVRNLFRKQRVDTGALVSWFESRPGGSAPRTAGERLREADFRFATAAYGVAPIAGWVQIPDRLADEPEALASFVDRRLMVRLGTAENRALTVDLLRHPDLAPLPYSGSYVQGVLAAFDEIEQTGGTGHAMIVNPRDYYGELVGSGSLLTDLAREKVMICRNRHVAPGHAIVGDFAMAARLLEAGHSVIKVAEPPPGTFAAPGTAVCAEVYEGVALQLPTHFYHVVPGGADD
ncbi:family 3 encapsulin nanocompartment shell protein [Streptomyces sp. NBC_01808]|uniref:family 3 encapsulin nanocompartment shell protein n=1 Tax=Streptomyces sp. NBC_01808 TaxID=2975947 RepID=UPI002DDAEBBD|nr:family 3 encapsulin nanocompartment shell protein [Streptomyces sp. NBC_01808]WSA38374.1 family 3 encapsulin nanocompartment shell protein [Streptomyces sp. NBC_01808]